MEKHREQLDYTLEEFLNKYRVPISTFNNFLDYAYNKGVEKNNKQLAKVQRDVRRFIKARMAKHLFGDIGFYKVWQEEDKMIKKALENLRSGKPLTDLKD